MATVEAPVQQAGDTSQPPGGAAAARGRGAAAAVDNENSGRWTQEEHERFLQGLDMYGKKWTKVAEVVNSRTTVQVRSHAQKYFQKMVKGGGRDTMEVLPRPGMPGGGIPRPYRRQRLDDDSIRHIPVPPPLQPFLPAGSGDIATGLYSYLSPSCVPTGTSGAGANANNHAEGSQSQQQQNQNQNQTQQQEQNSGAFSASVVDAALDSMAPANQGGFPGNNSASSSNGSSSGSAATKNGGSGGSGAGSLASGASPGSTGLPPFEGGQPDYSANGSTVTAGGGGGSTAVAGGGGNSGRGVGQQVIRYEDVQNSVPKWYQEGKDIPNLLSAAEELDWMVSKHKQKQQQQ